MNNDHIIRQWAEARGFHVPNNGRLPKSVRAGFRKSTWVVRDIDTIRRRSLPPGITSDHARRWEKKKRG